MNSLTDRFLKIVEALVVLDQQSGALPLSVKIELPPSPHPVSSEIPELKKQMEKIEELFEGLGGIGSPRSEDLAALD